MMISGRQVGYGTAVWCAVALAACGGNANLVARAGEQTLTVDALASLLTTGKYVPLQRYMVERWAFRWVEYALFAQRVADGDSMLDSLTVIEATWPDVSQALVDAFHDRLVEERLGLDSAAVDSAYRAGEQRLIDHILVRTPPDLSPPDRQAARRQAEAIRAGLAAGGSWEDANEANQDPAARQRGGTLGVIERGQMVPEFDRVAFALAPGELSEVTETAYGYHVVRRPALAEVWERFREGIEERLIARMDTAFLAELTERWRLRVREGAPAVMRDAADSPLWTFQRQELIGTYRGGRFTTGDFVRWLQALPVPVHMQVSSASDQQLRDLALSLMRNEVLVREARDAGMELGAEDYAQFREALREDIEEVRGAMGLDSALAGVTDPAERRRVAAQAVTAYLFALVERTRRTVTIPPFLAHKLRDESRWQVSSRGIDLALERAEETRARAVAGDARESAARAAEVGDRAP